MVKAAELTRNVLVALGLGFGAGGTLGLVFSMQFDTAMTMVYIGTFSFLGAAIVQLAINEYEMRKW